jgi:hypothetical protein
VPSVMMFGIGSNVQCKSSQVLVRRSWIALSISARDNVPHG